MKKGFRISDKDSPRTSSKTTGQRNRVEALAEEYVARKRAGEAVNVEQYIEQHPELATEMRELFPMMELLDRAVAAPGNEQPATAFTEIGSGTRLGEYELIKPIGRGGMGVVYQAQHVVLGSSVAVKLLPAGLDRPKLRERFQREASAAARMRHPNIVRVFDYGVHGETLYYVMELVEGCGLNQVIGPVQEVVNPISEAAPSDQVENKGRTVRDLESTQLFEITKSTNGYADETEFDLDSHAADSQIDRSKYPSHSGQDSLWHWVARIGVQAADALDYAHSAGVIHRDIKPGNLMIDADEKIHVMDFGLAKVADDHSLTATGDILGTMRYMPPESFAGRADHRSDIYSLGLTLYELLANRPAFEDVERGKLIPAITNGQITRLRKTIPKIPVDLETVIHKAIQVDPKDRYASAAEFRDDLKNFLTGQPVKARHTTWIYRSFRWVNRNKIVSSLATSVFVLLTAAVIAFAISAIRFENLASEKEDQRVAAMEAKLEANESEALANEHAKEANLNLLTAHLSDARGWSTSGVPGQKVEGLKALRLAISLARELDVFDQHRFEINTVAASLSTLCDLPLEKQWQHPEPVNEFLIVGFNRDLTEYVAVNSVDDRRLCKIFRLTSDGATLVETIPIPANVVLDKYGIRFSSDSRYIYHSVDVGQNSVPWIYDRKLKKSKILDFELPGSYRQKVRLLRSGVVLFVTRESELVGYDLTTDRISFQIPLPEDTVSSCLEVTNDESKVAVYDDGKPSVILVDLNTREIKALAYNEDSVVHLAWRPDGKQLAFQSANSLVLWDIQRNVAENVIVYSHRDNSQAAYSHDGRFLLTTGWDAVTLMHDTRSEFEAIRVERPMHGVSHDGRHVVLHDELRGHFEIRPILTSSVVSEYSFGGQEIDLDSVVDASTGILWSASEKNVKAIDLVNQRVLSYETGLGLTLDRQGRDFAYFRDGKLQRMPIQFLSQSNITDASETVESTRITIGPPETLKLSASPALQKQQLVSVKFNADGSRLAISLEHNHKRCQIVLDRNNNWKTIAHVNSLSSWPTDLSLHPTRPLLLSTVHHSNSAQVIDYEAKKILFNINSQRCFLTSLPDGTRFLAGNNGKLQAYSFDSLEKIAETSKDFQIKHEFCSVSADSRWVAVESQNPRGVMLLEAQHLTPVLMLRGNHRRPQSNVGQFDSTGRFLVCNRGKSAIGVWDLYELRQHFESLDLEWPLDGLGNPTPMRDPNVPVEIIWESDEPIDQVVTALERIATGQWGTDWFLTSDPRTQPYERAVLSTWKRFNRKMSSLFGGLNRTFQIQPHPARSQQQVLAMIKAATDEGAEAFDAGDPEKCSEIYFQLLSNFRSRKIENADAEIASLIVDTIKKAEQSENDASRNGQAWVLRRGIDSIAEKLINAKTGKR